MFMRESLFIVGQTVGSLLLAAACSKAAPPDAEPRPPKSERTEGPRAVAPGKLIFYDGFVYVDDLAMASAEDRLPKYRDFLTEGRSHEP